MIASPLTLQVIIILRKMFKRIFVSYCGWSILQADKAGFQEFQVKMSASMVAGVI
jgi:hypothetical protein